MNSQPEHPAWRRERDIHNGPVSFDPDNPELCMGVIFTVYATHSRRIVRIGRMCRRCLGFWPNTDYWNQDIREEEKESGLRLVSLDS